jgi:uncharacterized protein YegP (UPF0339 family)
MGYDNEQDCLVAIQLVKGSTAAPVQEKFVESRFTLRHSNC